VSSCLKQNRPAPKCAVQRNVAPKSAMKNGCAKKTCSRIDNCERVHLIELESFHYNFKTDTASIMVCIKEDP